jgi:predicted O-methyltransferase YrrM
MMGPEVYQQLHLLAKSLTYGDVLDIGVGQGATTIAYALGMNHGKVIALDQFFQVRSANPHRFTLKDHPSDAVELNVQVFTAHLVRYGVANRVTTLVGTTDAMADSVPKSELGILSIDVDGHIDRDLSHFYDRVCEGGMIVIDDYWNGVNRLGRKAVSSRSANTPSQIEDFIQSLDVAKRRLLLGKHLLTYRLATYFLANGLFTLEQVVGKSTAIFRKTSKKPYDSYSLLGVHEIEQSIINDFRDLCTGTLEFPFP